MSAFMQKCRDNTPLIMGIVNATPDSFSDGGDYNAPDKAIAHGLKMLEQGTDILDIGGESTRPNADIISTEEEMRRVLPIIEGLAGRAPYISIDTRNAKTMREAIRLGANIVNDISALTHDPEAIHVIIENNVPTCLMHMKGTPQTMQSAPNYENVIDEIMAYFEDRLQFFEVNGGDKKNIILDPGIGFGKTLEHNLTIIKHIGQFKKLGCPVLLGASRKSFVDALCHAPNAKDRLGGSIAAVLSAVNKGVNIVRVHDVLETKQAIKTYQAIG